MAIKTKVLADKIKTNLIPEDFIDPKYGDKIDTILTLLSNPVGANTQVAKQSESHKSSLDASFARLFDRLADVNYNVDVLTERLRSVIDPNGPNGISAEENTDPVVACAPVIETVNDVTDKVAVLQDKINFILANLIT